MIYQNLPTFGIRGGRPSNRSHHRSLARTATLFALIGAMIGAVSLTTVSSAQPASDRRGGVIFVEPTTDENFFRIGLSWSFAVSPSSAPRNLSTTLDLYVNGTRIQSTLVDVIVGSGSTYCGSPPCNGSCGSALVNGQNAAMLCYVDGPPPSDDCDCGQWITTDIDGSCYLEPGDEIMVLLRPAPGSVPEENGGNDATRMTFLGGTSFWNRGVRDVELQPTSVPDVYDVEVAGAVEFDGLGGTPYLNLSFEAILQVNGVPVATQYVQQNVEPATSGSCFYLGCGNYCGVVNQIPLNCDELLFHGCTCGGSWLGLFQDQELDPGDEIMVILRPAPGALPELPGFEGDDLFVLGNTSGVEPEMTAATEKGRLLLASPNPARASVGTKLSFELTRPAAVRLDIVDVAGRTIRNVAHAKFPAGRFSRAWDLHDDSDERVANGVYFYTMSLDGEAPDAMKLLVVE